MSGRQYSPIEGTFKLDVATKPAMLWNKTNARNAAQTDKGDLQAELCGKTLHFNNLGPKRRSRNDH